MAFKDFFVLNPNFPINGHNWDNASVNRVSKSEFKTTNLEAYPRFLMEYVNALDAANPSIFVFPEWICLNCGIMVPKTGPKTKDLFCLEVMASQIHSE